MNAPLLTLHAVDSEAPDLVGHSFTLAGQLTMARHAFITITEGDRSVRLQILDKTLERRLVPLVSINVGGDLYDDPVRIVGVLAGGDDGELKIASVCSGVLYRDGKETIF